jgi:hypothetical protein
MRSGSWASIAREFVRQTAFDPLVLLSVRALASAFFIQLCRVISPNPMDWLVDYAIGVCQLVAVGGLAVEASVKLVSAAYRGLRPRQEGQ